MSRRRSAVLTGVLVGAAVAGMAGSPVGAQDASPTPSTARAADTSPSPPPGPLAGIEFLARGERDPGATVPDRDLAAVVAGNTAFALDLLRQEMDGSADLVLGPLSISFAMAMQ